MPTTVAERSPGDKFWNHVWETMWWQMTKLPLGEKHASWLQLRHPINLHKGLSFPFCLLCMSLTGSWTHTTRVYTAIHGTYG